MIAFLKDWENTAYPEMIRDLPEVDINVKGIRGWLMQAEEKQVAFFDIQAGAEVPPHSHCAQFGFVLEGETVMKIGGETKTLRKGDWYFIPDGVVHSASFPKHLNAIDIFDSPNRYKVRKQIR